jgi:hypothetical protein
MKLSVIAFSVVLWLFGAIAIGAAWNYFNGDGPRE